MSLEPPSGSASDQPSAEQRAIASIRVEGLHGKFSYELDIAPQQLLDGIEEPEVTTVTEDRLTLLYGRNGTGKTSLLRLLFHALSPAGNRGHRSAMRRIRFREFSVFLTDGSYVRYRRTGEEDVGSMLAELRVGAQHVPIQCEFHSTREMEMRFFGGSQIPLPLGQTLTEFPVEASDLARFAETSGWTYTYHESKDDQFVNALDVLGMNPVFLEDSRAITSDVLDPDEAKRARATGRAARAARVAQARGLDADEESLRRREVDIEEALERVRLYLSQLAFAGTQAGSARVDTVYVNVAGAIIEHSSKVGRPNKRLVPKMQATVDALNERAARFQAYGLLPESPMLELAERLKDADDKHGPLLVQVLTPHLDGFAQRMDALEPGLAAVAAFVDALNTFLGGKHVEFSPGPQGLRIIDDSNEESISPNDLSSGEKQIVLLFSDIIALQNETRLFLIDEPELSLNPDWAADIDAEPSQCDRSERDAAHRRDPFHRDHGSLSRSSPRAPGLAAIDARYIHLDTGRVHPALRRRRRPGRSSGRRWTGPRCLGGCYPTLGSSRHNGHRLRLCASHIGRDGARWQWLRSARATAYHRCTFGGESPGHHDPRKCCRRDRP